jgi:hypothetical protein
MRMRGTNPAAVNAMSVMQRKTSHAASPEPCDRMAGYGPLDRKGERGRVQCGRKAIRMQ